MTDMQVKAQANALQAEKNAIERASLAEKMRANKVQEGFQDVKMLHDYGPSSYIPLTDTGRTAQDPNDPRTIWNTIRDVIGGILDPLNLIGKIFGGK